MSHYEYKVVPAPTKGLKVKAIKTPEGRFALTVQEVLNAMDPIDREVLALRHFEELTNSEVAEWLDIQQKAASIRYVRAIARLKDILARVPGFFDSQERQP